MSLYPERWKPNRCYSRDEQSPERDLRKSGRRSRQQSRENRRKRHPSTSRDRTRDRRRRSRSSHRSGGRYSRRGCGCCRSRSKNRNSSSRSRERRDSVKHSKRRRRNSSAHSDSSEESSTDSDSGSSGALFRTFQTLMQHVDEGDSTSSESEIDETDPKRAVAWEWDQGFPDEVMWYATSPDPEAVRKLQVCSVPDTKCISLLTEKNLDTVDGCREIVKHCFQGVRIGSFNGKHGEEGGCVRRWRFKEILGLGHGSTVLAGTLKMRSEESDKESQQMAFKLVLKATKASRIAGVEAPLLRKLDGKGFPRLFFRLSRRMREAKKFRVVLLGVERQGSSLDESAGELGLEEAFVVGVHLVQALRRLHELGWAHLSIKPENICWGLSSDTNEDDHRVCVLLDLERAERLGEEISGAIKGMAPFCGRTGVFQALRLYSSGIVYPTHDLESVYYIMMSLILPPDLSQWKDYVNSRVSRNAQVEKMKRHELSSGLFPHAVKRYGKTAVEPLRTYLEYVRSCDPKSPNYDHLLTLLATRPSALDNHSSKSKS